MTPQTSKRCWASSSPALADRSAFGKVISQTGTENSAFGFQGQVENESTGQGVFCNRNYSSQQGRFTSQDPIRFASGQMNHYQFVGNHPHMGTDPSGLQEPRGGAFQVIQEWGTAESSGADLHKGLKAYFHYYTSVRKHSSLDHQTPVEVYRSGRPNSVSLSI